MLLLGCGYAGYALHVAGASGFLCALVLSLSLHGLDGAGRKPTREAVSFDCNLTFSEPVGGMAGL